VGIKAPPENKAEFATLPSVELLKLLGAAINAQGEDAVKDSLRCMAQTSKLSSLPPAEPPWTCRRGPVTTVANGGRIEPSAGARPGKIGRTLVGGGRIRTGPEEDQQS
jgi:hypothetical protein